MKQLKRLISIIYVAVLIVMGAATFVENAKGTSFVHKNIYGSWWFTALWVLLALLATIYIIRYKALWTKKMRQLSVILLHASFLIILAGALLTHLTGRSGTIHLRMNEPQDIVEIEHNGQRYLHRLNFAVELTDFQIIEDEEGNAKDFRSDFRILPQSPPHAHSNYDLNAQRPTSSDNNPNNQRPVLSDTIAEPSPTFLTVSMNKIATHGQLRFYQMSYDYDLRGSTLMLNHDPYGIPVTYCGYILLFLSFIWVVVQGNQARRNCRESQKSRNYQVLAATLLLTAAWCIYYFILDGSWAQIPVLRHPLLIFHVVIIILAYALLLIQTIISALALFRNYQLKTNNFSLLRPALCLLTIGIFLGAIWANISWGNYWSWDSKEVWALITLMIYAVPLHHRSLPAFQTPHLFHVYMLAAFLTVLMTYFGVNYFLSGMHSYT